MRTILLGAALSAALTIAPAHAEGPDDRLIQACGAGARALHGEAATMMQSDTQVRPAPAGHKAVTFGLTVIKNGVRTGPIQVYCGFTQPKEGQPALTDLRLGGNPAPEPELRKFKDAATASLK